MATAYGKDTSVGSSVQMKKPHLARRKRFGGIPAEIKNLSDTLNTQLVNQSAVVTTAVFTNPPAADATAFLTATATVATATVYEDTTLDGTVGDGVLDPPRQVVATVAGATPADAPATATVTGLDIDGNVMTETLTLPQTATTVVGTKCFAQVTKIEMPAADGTAATVSFGTGVRLGLKVNPMVLGTTTVGIMAETYDGSVVTNGTLVGAATHEPHGSYSPNTAANGTHDYAIAYLASPTLGKP